MLPLQIPTINGLLWIQIGAEFRNHPQHPRVEPPLWLAVPPILRPRPLRVRGALQRGDFFRLGAAEFSEELMIIE